MRRPVIDFYFRHFSPGDYALGLTRPEAEFMQEILDAHGYLSNKAMIAKGEFEGQWGVKCLGIKPGIKATPSPIYLADEYKEQ